MTNTNKGEFKMSKRATVTVSTEEGFNYLLKKLKQGEEKKHHELMSLLKEGFPEIGDGQGSGIIYRGHTNQNAILKKEGSNYRLLTEEEKEKQTDGMVMAKGKLDSLIEEIENIPGSQFRDYDSFRRYKDLVEILQKASRV